MARDVLQILDLPPWESAPYFSLPNLTNVAINLGANGVQLVAANPLRWGVVFATQNGGQPFTVGPVAGVGTSGKTGILITTSQPPLIVTYPVWGGAVTQQWTGGSTGGGAAQVIILEILLTDWPHERGRELDRMRLDAPPPPRANPTRAPGVKGGLGVIDWLSARINQLTQNRR